MRLRLKSLLKDRTQQEQFLAYAILGMTLGIMLAVVWPSLNGNGYLSAWDAGGHLLKAHYFAHNLLPEGHLSGWFPLWHGGFDLFQFYPPLLYYVLGPLTLVLQPELALRLVTAGLWLGLVPVTYYFLRSFQLNRMIAASGTTLLLALNASFGIGLGALYGVGLLPNGLGFILAIWVLGRLKRDLSQPDRRPYQFLVTGLLLGFLILAHTFSTYWLLLASLLLLATEAVGGNHHLQRAGKRFGFVVLTAVLVSAYWWVPLVLNMDFMGQTGAIQQSPRGEIASGLLLAKDSGGWVISILAVAGLAYLWFKKQRRTPAFFVGLGLLSLLLSLNTINYILPFHDVIASSQFIRFQAFFAWLLMALAVFGLAGIWAVVRRLKLPYVGVTLYASVLAMLFVLLVLPTLDEKRGFIYVFDNPATDELSGAGDFLKERVATGEFVLTEFNWDARFSFGSPHFVNQRLPFATDFRTWDLDGNFPEGTRGAAKPVLIASVLDQTDYVRTQQQFLESRGVRYIVATNPRTARLLTAEPWLKPVWTGTVINAFELIHYDRRFGLSSAAAAQIREVTYDDPGVYRVRFRQPVELSAGSSLALSDHPWLRVTGDGRRITSGADQDGTLVLKQASGPISELTVRYQPAAAASVASGVSIVALLAILVLLLRPMLLERLLEIAKARRRGRRPRKRAPGR